MKLLRRVAKTLATIGQVLAVTYVALNLFSGLIFITPRGYQLLSDALGINVARGVVFVAVLGAGFLAHWFKKKNQRWYGVVEVTFGAAGAFNIVIRMPGTEQSMITEWVA